MLYLYNLLDIVSLVVCMWYMMGINTSITRPCVIVHILTMPISSHPRTRTDTNTRLLITEKYDEGSSLWMSLSRRSYTWMIKLYLVNSTRNSPKVLHKQSTTRCLIRGRNFIHLVPHTPFSSLTTNTTHDGDRSQTSRLTSKSL